MYWHFIVSIQFGRIDDGFLYTTYFYKGLSYKNVLSSNLFLYYCLFPDEKFGSMFDNGHSSGGSLFIELCYKCYQTSHIVQHTVTILSPIWSIFIRRLSYMLTACLQYFEISYFESWKHGWYVLTILS